MINKLKKMSHNFKILRCFKTASLVLALTLLIVSETFTAAISDNDGAAFITKAEFDSLNTEFQNSLNQYNSGIDNKIDEAISSYISGIKTSSTRTLNIINDSWKKVSAVNKAFKNTFQPPDVDLLFMNLSLFSQIPDWGPDATQEFYYIVEHASRAQYRKDFNSSGNVYRNLVTVTGTSPTDIGDIIWRGRAIRYREIWNISRVIPNWPENEQQWPFLDRPDAYTFDITMTNFFTLTGSGYVTNWDSVKGTRWPVGYIWGYKNRSSGNRSTRTVTFDSSFIWDNFRTAIELDADSEGNKIEYDHIIAYDKDNTWEVSNSDWTTLINQSPNSNVKANDLKTACTLTSKARSHGSAFHAGTSAATDVPYGSEDIVVSQSTTADDVIPSLGLFKTTVPKSSDIYQDNVKTMLQIDKSTSIEKVKPKLHDGFQLAACKKDDEVTWEPVFNYTHVHNGADTYTDNHHEVDVYFSAVPFTNNTSSTKAIKVKVNDSSIESDYATTSSRKCKVKFKVPETCIVYVKWVPHTTSTYLNSDWIVTLDIENSNKYIVKRDQN